MDLLERKNNKRKQQPEKYGFTIEKEQQRETTTEKEQQRETTTEKEQQRETTTEKEQQGRPI